MARMAYLFLEENNRIVRCDLSQKQTRIGRGEDNDFQLTGASILESHAQIVRVDDVYLLRAISEAEVSVNGNALHGAYELQNGDRILLADEELLFARAQLVSPTTVCLMVRRAEQVEFGFWMAKSTIAIGGTAGDLVIRDAGLASIHAVIENYCEHGQFVVAADSAQHSLLNGRPIQGRMRVTTGDVLQFADAELRVRVGTSIQQAVVGGMDAKRRDSRFSSNRLANATRRRPPSVHGRGRKNQNALVSPAVRQRSGEERRKHLGEVGDRQMSQLPRPRGWSEELWYMPKERSAQKERLPRPIIRPRGDLPPASLSQGKAETVDTDAGTMVRDISKEHQRVADDHRFSSIEVEDTPTRDTPRAALKEARVSKSLNRGQSSVPKTMDREAHLRAERDPADTDTPWYVPQMAQGALSEDSDADVKNGLTQKLSTPDA